MILRNTLVDSIFLGQKANLKNLEMMYEIIKEYETDNIKAK